MENHHISQNQSYNHQNKNTIDSYYLSDRPKQNHQYPKLNLNHNQPNKSSTHHNQNPFIKYATDSINHQQQEQYSNRQKQSYQTSKQNFINQSKNHNYSHLISYNQNYHNNNDYYYIPPQFSHTNHKSDPHLLTSNYTEENQFTNHKQLNNQQITTTHLNYQPFNQMPQILNQRNNPTLFQHNLQKQNFKDQTFKIFVKKNNQNKKRQQSLDAQITQNTPSKSYGTKNINLIQRQWEKSNKFQQLKSQNQNPNLKYNLIDQSASQSQYLKSFQNIQSLQSLMQEKIKMKQATIRQLQSQLKLQNQERVHLYKLNVSLQQQYRNLSQSIKQKQDDQVKGLIFLLERMKRLKAQRLQQKKNLLKQQKILSQQQRQLFKGRKQFLKRDKQIIQKQLEIVKKTKSKSQLGSGYCTRNHTITIGSYKDDIKVMKQKDDKILLQLVGELDRLKHVVERKMKSSHKNKK